VRIASALAEQHWQTLVVIHVENRKRRQSKELEAHAMKLAWLREAALHPSAQPQDVRDIKNDIDSLRRRLPNLAPSVFTQATAAAFRPPDLVVSSAQELVRGLTHAGERASVIADADQLFAAVRRSGWAPTRDDQGST
jgi:hypothetical protein